MLLTETVLQTKGKYRLIEATAERPLPKGAIAEILFDEIQVGDRPNGNGRVYPWSVLKAANERLLKTLKEERLASFDGHPKNNEEMVLGKIPAVLHDFEINESEGKITNASYYLADNTLGRDTLPLLQLGMVIGTSSRGNGSLKEGVHEGKHGKVSGQIVQEDLILEGYDLVLKPSVVTARASGLREEQGDGNVMTDKLLKDVKDLEELRTLVPGVFKQLIDEALKLADEKLNQRIDRHEAEIHAEVVEAIEKPLKESIAKLEKDLADSKKALGEAQKKATSLSESATANEKKLQESVDGLQKQLDEKQKQLESTTTKVNAIELRENMAAARAHVIESTDGNPFCDVLRAATLGTDPKTGVKVNEKLTESYKSVKPPQSIDEAKARLASVEQILSSAGLSTEKGHSHKGDTDLTESKTESRRRLLTLSGIKDK